MEKVYFTAKKHITHFKLDFCCWFAPVRVGLLFVGYINIIIDLVCMMGIANDGLAPTITKVQDTLISDFVSKPIPILAYAIELGFNVVLLCAVYRRDIVLLRVFLYYTVMAVIMSIMTYSIVLLAVPFHIQLAIISSILFQTYCILLIRSVMVELKMENKNYELPRLVMSSLLKDRSTPCIYDPNNGKLQEVIIAEAPKKQEVQITVVDQDEKLKDTKVTEIKKVAEVKMDIEPKKIVKVKVDTEPKKSEEVKVDTEPKKSVEVKKNSEVKAQIEAKENKDEKKKTDKKCEEEKKKEEKKTKEDKKKEEKAIKDEKKKEDKKVKEEKKKEEKKSKEEKKKDEKFTSIILKKYKHDKEAENEEKTEDLKKDLKETSLPTVSEHPKE